MSRCACLTSVQAMFVIAQAASSCKTGISCRASNSTKRGTIPASTTRSTGGNLSVQWRVLNGDRLMVEHITVVTLPNSPVASTFLKKVAASMTSSMFWLNNFSAFCGRASKLRRTACWNLLCFFDSPSSSSSWYYWMKEVRKGGLREGVELSHIVFITQVYSRYPSSLRVRCVISLVFSNL